MTTTPKLKLAALGKMDYIPHANTVFCVTFDFADATHFVYERHEMDNLIPFRNFHGHAATYELPANADASMFEEWIAEIVQPFVTRVNAGYATAWKDGNEIAIYSADAISAKEQIDYILDHGNGSMAAIPRLEEWQGRFYAGEYLWEIRHYLIENYGITAETSDEQIFGIADKINAYMVNDYVFLDGIADYLLKLRDNIREDEIAIRAKQVEMLGAIDEHAPAKEKETMIMKTPFTPYVTPTLNKYEEIMDNAFDSEPDLSKI